MLAMHPSRSRGQAATIKRAGTQTAGGQAHKPYLEDNAAANWEDLATACQYRLPELARLCHVSMRTLQRHFRKAYNTTLSDWVRHVKLERARAMLAEAESVKCVAFDLGYKQPSHFTRDFKEYFGVPPSALRWPLEVRIQVALRENGAS